MGSRAKKDRRAARRRVDLSPEGREIIQFQLEAFGKRFGREPGPGDPVFFDMASDVPQFRTDAAAVVHKIAEALRTAGMPHYAYAYEKTDGVLVTATNQNKWAPEDIVAWEAALDEYFLAHPEEAK